MAPWDARGEWRIHVCIVKIRSLPSVVIFRMVYEDGRREFVVMKVPSISVVLVMPIIPTPTVILWAWSGTIS